MMRRRLAAFATLATIALGTLAVPGLALAEDPKPPPPTKSPCFDIVLDNPSNANKASLCHFTGSDGNPFNLNEVGASAVNSHFDHHGDCYKFFNQPQVCIP